MTPRLLRYLLLLDESDWVESVDALSLEDPLPVDPVPVVLSLWCFLLECFLVVVVEVSLEPDPVDPLIPLGELEDELLSPLIPLEEPLLPVPLLVLSLPVEVPGVLPVALDLSDPVEELELPEPIEEPLLPLELPEPIELPDWSVLPAAPFVMMSSDCTLSVSPEPEKLARTRSPSLMSSIEAREPSFITCVVESTLSFLSLPERVSSFFDRSKFWTRPLSVSKWPLVVPDGLADEGLVEEVAPLPVLLSMLPLPVEEDPVPIDLSELLLPSDPWLESWVDPLMPVLGLLPELPL